MRGVDLKYPEFAETLADDFVVGDLRDPNICRQVVDRRFNEVYQLAADMGGAGYIFTGEHNADVMHNSATINLNVLDACRRRNVRDIFYSSSACMYPSHNQEDRNNPHVPKIRPIQPIPIANMDAKNFLVNDYIFLTIGTTA